MGVQGTRGGRTSWPRAKGLGAGRSAGGAGRTVTGTALQAGSPFAPHSRGLEELPAPNAGGVGLFPPTEIDGFQHPRLPQSAAPPEA